MLQEGRKFLEEAGIKELSLREIARRAGVSEAAPSWHFGGKDGLLAGIASEGYLELLSERKRIASSDLALVDKVRAMMVSYVQFALANRGLFNLMLGPRVLDFQAYPELRESSMASFNLFADTVKDLAAETGWPKEQSTLAAHAAWSVEHGLATLILSTRMPRPGVDMEIMIGCSIDLMIRSIVLGPIPLTGTGRPHRHKR